MCVTSSGASADTVLLDFALVVNKMFSVLFVGAGVPRISC